MRRYLPFAIIVAVFVIAIGGGLMLFRWKQPASAPTAPIPSAAPAASPVVPATPTVEVVPSNVPLTKEEAPAKPGPAALHVRGGANAPVTLEEFGDFQCTPCGQLFPILTKVEEHYGNRLRVVFRHYPLYKHEHGALAARAAEAAGLQGRFWEMHDLLFENASRWTKGVDTVGPEVSPSRRLQSTVLAMDIEVRDVLFSYAERLKLDVDRFKADLDSDEVKARLEADRLHADALGIDRTPTLYLNGRQLVFSVSRTVEGLQAEIDAELDAQAKGAKASSAQTAPPQQPK